MEEYLASTQYINWQHPDVFRLAKELTAQCESKETIVHTCFEFVRDQIKHSWDYQLGPLTIKASDVLQHGTGFCYAKSHLLAALLRANKIPTALCYQRLTISNDKPPFSLHGLNSVYLENIGWYRIDARGNKEGVDAQFCPPQEKLAFEIRTVGEQDIEGIFSEPLDVVVQALTTAENIETLAANLPDI